MTDQGGPSRPKPLPWIMAPWALPFWLASVEWGWWDVFRAEFAASPPVPAASLPSPALAVSLGVIGKLMGHVSETAFYVLLWRGRGARLPFWRFLSFVVSASIVDQVAYRLSAHFEPGEAPAWLVWLAGLHLASGTSFQDSPAVRAAFGSISLLTATRIAITAGGQAQGTHRPVLEAIGWTLLTWLLTRLAAMWSIDLIRGMSPLGGG